MNETRYCMDGSNGEVYAASQHLLDTDKNMVLLPKTWRPGDPLPRYRAIDAEQIIDPNAGLDRHRVGDDEMPPEPDAVVTVGDDGKLKVTSLPPADHSGDTRFSTEPAAAAEAESSDDPFTKMDRTKLIKFARENRLNVPDATGVSTADLRNIIRRQVEAQDPAA